MQLPKVHKICHCRSNWSCCWQQPLADTWGRNMRPEQLQRHLALVQSSRFWKKPEDKTQQTWIYKYLLWELGCLLAYVCILSVMHDWLEGASSQFTPPSHFEQQLFYQTVNPTKNIWPAACQNRALKLKSLNVGSENSTLSNHSPLLEHSSSFQVWLDRLHSPQEAWMQPPPLNPDETDLIGNEIKHTSTQQKQNPHGIRLLTEQWKI